MPHRGTAILALYKMAPAPTLPQVFGKYTLLSHLATGGMAEVYFARQSGPSGFERELVIKRILPPLAADPNFVQMFLAEATLAARVNHPNIAHIYELGDHDGDYFIAMEYVPGVTLEKILELVKDRQGHQSPGLPWPIAVRMIAGAAEGLDHAHKALDVEGRPLQLVHRDVSPTNVMVSWDGVTKILDFGVAKSEVQSAAAGPKVRTGAGVLKGKLPYMSPEQLQGLELDARSDVFSLGAVLYELVCGQRPFPGESVPQLTVQIVSQEPISPEVFAPSLPPDLKRIIWRAMSKSVAERYQSARDLKQDLEQFLADEHATCSNYDMEAYLRELVPDRTPFTPTVPRAESYPSAVSPPSTQSPPPPSGSAVLASEQREVAMSTDKAPENRVGTDEKSGRLGPLNAHGLDLDAEERRQKRDKGGSPVVTIVIAALVFITAAVFYILHARAVDRNQTPAIRPSDATIGPSTPPPSATTAATAGTPVAPPASKPATGPGTPPAVPTPPVPGTPAAAKDPKAGKEPAKDDKEPGKSSDSELKHEKRKPHHKPEDSGEAPHALPRLPLPPPTE